MEKKVYPEIVRYHVVYGASCLDRSFLSLDEARKYAIPRVVGSEWYKPTRIEKSVFVTLDTFNYE